MSYKSYEQIMQLVVKELHGILQEHGGSSEFESLIIQDFDTGDVRVKVMADGDELAAWRLSAEDQVVAKIASRFQRVATEMSRLEFAGWIS